LSHTLNKNIF